jgi:HSP20 family protein
MATLVRFDPFRELASLQDEMSKLMGGFLGEGVTERGSRGWIPALDAWETENEVVYAFDLPGIPEDKISIEYEDGTLTVTAEREREQTRSGDGYRRYERRFGTFQRTIPLPSGVKESDVKAKYENGVLELRVNKPEQPKPRRIPIAKSEAKTIEGKVRKKS